MRAHHLGVVHVDAVPRENHEVGARGVGCPDDGARVPGVTNGGEHGGQQGPTGTLRVSRVQRLAQRRRGGPHDGEHTLGVGAHGVEHLGGAEAQEQPGGAGVVDDLRVARRGGRRQVEVADGRRRVPDDLPHALRSFDQVLPVPGARRTPSQCPYVLDAVGSRIRERHVKR